MGGYASMTKKERRDFWFCPDRDGMARKSLIRPTGEAETQSAGASIATISCGWAALTPRFSTL